MKKSAYALLLFGLAFFIACSNNDDEGAAPFDPNKPLKLTTFYPDSGGIATQVILRGENFGTNANDLRVYFNKKQAAVVKAYGDMAYVITPRLPGEICDISVAIGKDSLVYETPFKYQIKVQVSTLCGNPNEGDSKDGTLAAARLKNPDYMGIDNEDNIYFVEYGLNNVRQINEKKNQVITLLKSPAWREGFGTDAEGSVVYFCTGLPGYFKFDPLQQWTPRRVTPSKVDPTEDFNFTQKEEIKGTKYDNMLYTVNFLGDVIQIDPATDRMKVYAKKIAPDSYNFIAFDKRNPNLMYIPMHHKHKIVVFDLITKTVKDFAGTGAAGHQDGEKDFAMFNGPCNICIDEDNNIYVADTYNRVIRKVSPEGIVTTEAGTPGKRGYLDGAPDVALFDEPYGIVIDSEGTIFVSEYYKHCIRKLSIE